MVGGRIMGDLPFSDKTIEEMGADFFLIGLINRFNNRFQAATDALFEELSWKQAFFLSCVRLFEEAPTIKDMAQLLGCSHQNAKQLLLKLERLGFVAVQQDTADLRKQRIHLTEKAAAFMNKYAAPSAAAMDAIFADIRPEDLQTTIQVLLALDGRLKQYQEELK